MFNYYVIFVVMYIPAVALDPCAMVSELMKNPKPIDSAVSTVTGLSVILKGF